MAYMA
jgi:hypothetical protein